MPELSQLSKAGLPQINFQPINPASYINQGWVPNPLPPDTTKASADMGRAAVLNAVTKTIAELPDTFSKAYLTGQKMSAGKREADSNALGLQLKTDILTGKPMSDDRRAALSGLTIGPDGGTSLKVEDPRETEAKLKALEYRGVPSGAREYDLLNKQFESGGATPPAATHPTGYLDWIKGLEGKNLKAYSDSGQTSIGYGTHGKPGEVIDDAEAERRLNSELSEHASAVDSLASKSGVALTPAQRDALISFNFNTGAAHRIFEVASKDGALDPKLATDKMAEFKHADATAKDGSLVGRRNEEIKRFNMATPTEGTTVDPQRRAEIEAAAANSAGQLSNMDFGPSGLSAANDAGVIPPAPIQAAPALQNMEVRRATIGRDPQTRSIILAPTPESVTAVTPSGQRIPLVTPASAAAAAKQPQAFGSIEELTNHYHEQGAVPTEIHSTQDGFVATKLTTSPKLSPATRKIVEAAGYAPKPGETEAEIAINARKQAQTLELVPPEERGRFATWRNGLTRSNPIVKQYYTAKHESDVIEAALSGGLTPAAALGAIDSYVKAMRGGAATQGMTKILEEAQPLVQRLKLKWAGLTGGPNENAVLTPEMASDIKSIVGKIKESSGREIEELRDASIEDWSSFGVPEGAVKKTFNTILGGRRPGEIPESAATTPEASAPDSKDKGMIDWLNSEGAKSNPAKAATIRAILKAKGLLQ